MSEGSQLLQLAMSQSKPSRSAAAPPVAKKRTPQEEMAFALSLIDRASGILRRLAGAAPAPRARATSAPAGAGAPASKSRSARSARSTASGI